MVGQRFPDGGIDPLLLAGVVAGEFASQPDWRTAAAPGEPWANEEPEYKRDLEILLGYARSADTQTVPVDEIVAQSASFSEYFARLVACSPESRPNAYALILIGIQVGGLVAAHFKLRYMRPRPGQVMPELNPVIPTPRHPAYPSGHALQSFMIAKILSSVVPAMKPYLDTLACEIARNRERARVHYPSDSGASFWMVDPIYSELRTIPLYDKIRAAAVNEISTTNITLVNATGGAPTPLPLSETNVTSVSKYSRLKVSPVKSPAAPGYGGACGYAAFAPRAGSPPKPPAGGGATSAARRR